MQFTLLVGILLMATVSAFAAKLQDDDKVELTLLITSGTSGQLFGDDGATIASLAATIRSTAEEARAEGRSVVVFDAGRTLLPYAESRFDGGTAMIEVLRSAGCAVFAPAPIDFALGVERVNALASAQPAIIRPFSVDTPTESDQMKETAEIQAAEGLVLEVHSLMNPAYADDLASIGVEGATALQAPAEAKLDDRIRLAVIHSRGHGKQMANRLMTWRLVGAPAGIDVIFDPDLGADVVLRSVSADTPVVLAGRNQDPGRTWTVARLDLEVARADGPWRVIKADMSVIDADPEIAVDSRLASILDAAELRFEQTQSETFPPGSPSTRDELVVFVLRALRESAHTEVAVLNQGALRPVAAVHFEGGRLTREAVVRLLSFDQLLRTGQLKGSDIEALAAESVRRVQLDGSPRKDSLVFEGVTYNVKNEGTTSATISNLRINGRPVRSEDLYSVVTNNFLAAGGDEYPTLTEMHGDWLRGPEGEPLELRAEIVIPRLQRGEQDFVDLDQRALWHWGIDRASFGFYKVTTGGDGAYDEVSDARARASDSTAMLAELRGFVVSEKPNWAWENLLWGRYGVLDLDGVERRETDDHLRLETSVVVSRASLLGGSPYGSFDIVTEFHPGEDATGASRSRRFEQTLAAGIDWTTGYWPRIRFGFSARNFSHIDRDPQLGFIAEAFYKKKATAGWPGIDAHVLGEYMKAEDSNVSRFDLDVRLPFPLYGKLELTPAFNYYVYSESALPGSASYFRFSLNLQYSWAGKHQSW